MKSRLSRACDISPSVRREVFDRDGGQCMICGAVNGLQTAHYISRARLGLGIPQNLALLCPKCHLDYDNGKYRREIEKLFREHLMAHYPDWDENGLTYKKWRDL